MKKKVGTFKIWLLAVAAVVAFSVLPKVSSLATEDQELVVEENKQKTADAAGDEPAAGNKQETSDEVGSESAAGNEQESSGEVANLKAQGLEIPVSKVKVSETIKHRLAYTVSYNHDTRQPNWVAWVLTGEHASGKLPRGKFADDEDMPAPVGTLADYYNSGLDRGHMCPAGDNKWSQQAMDECFLMTNMCPQNHSLNAGVWNTIEQQCRNWAKQYGKVYIVCGPIFLNKEHRKLGKNKVVVPDAFFKVVLHTGKNPQAIGFICRNQSQKGRKKTEFVNSVDEVERITGYDFFPQLPDDVEKRVEAKAEMF